MGAEILGYHTTVLWVGPVELLLGCEERFERSGVIGKMPSQAIRDVKKEGEAKIKIQKLTLLKVVNGFSCVIITNW